MINIKEEIRKKYESIFKFSLDYIYVHDLKGKFIDANDLTLNVLGYNREEILNLSFIDLIDKKQIPIAIKAIKEIRENFTEFHRKIGTQSKWKNKEVKRNGRKI